MQTFDVLQSASSSASPLNGETDFSPQKPPTTGEKFGDVMNRALSAPPSDPQNEDTETSTPPGQVTKHKKTSSTDTSAPKRAIKSKKSPQDDSVNDVSTAAQVATVATCVPQAVQAINTQIVPEDEGTSEDAPEVDATKCDSPKAIGNSNDAAPAPIQLLMVASSSVVAVPLPASTPTPTPVSTKAAKDSKGTSSPVPNVPAKIEVPGNVTTSIAEKTPETSAQSEQSKQLGNPVPEKPDLKSLEAKTPGEHPENSTPATLQTQPAQAQPAPSPDSHPDTAIPMEALQTSAPDVSNAQLTSSTQLTSSAQLIQPKVSKDTPTPPQADPGGISAAKQYTTMKKAEKTPKVAGQNEQDLPGSPSLGSEELSSAQKLPAHALAHASSKAESAASVEMPASSRISTNPEPAAPALSAVAVPPVNTTDARMRVLERTHDMVAMHAVRLAQTGSDSLHVVVKPGDGVQLSLELRQSEGMVQVRAALHKGDFAHMSQHWPELQQRLEARGVRVGTLTASDNFSSANQQNFQQHKQQTSQHDPLYAGAFAEFALAGSMSETPAARAARPTVHRGWETWA